ncbi:MAG: hypothetical protein ACKESB_01370 [Candidatus Hodgkinia cicadicola]
MRSGVRLALLAEAVWAAPSLDSASSNVVRRPLSELVVTEWLRHKAGADEGADWRRKDVPIYVSLASVRVEALSLRLSS